MAWIGIFFGMLAGFLAAGLAYAGLGWPLWASVLLYPAAGTATAVLVMLALVLYGAGGGTGGIAAARRAAPALS